MKAFSSPEILSPKRFEGQKSIQITEINSTYAIKIHDNVMYLL